MKSHSVVLPIQIIVIVFFLFLPSLMAEPTSENEERIKKYLERYPDADADKDGVLTFSELKSHFVAMRNSKDNKKSVESSAGKESAATSSNIRYWDEHKRNVLDFYSAKNSSSPAPVYVWFHGGGFSQGDKKGIRKNGGKILNSYLESGYAVVSCNYPFIELKNDILRNGMLKEYIENNYISKNDTTHREAKNQYLEIMRHCGRAIQFIRSKAKDWNIDPEKICAGGVSAGALISEWLAYSDDLASASSKDPVSRLSSRPQVAVSHLQPIGTDSLAVSFMDKGEPPLFIYTNAPVSDKIHHPVNATMIWNKAKDLKIPCVAVGGGRNQFPRPGEGKTWLSMQMEFCAEHLKLKSAPEE